MIGWRHVISTSIQYDQWSNNLWWSPPYAGSMQKDILLILSHRGTIKTVNSYISNYCRKKILHSWYNLDLVDAKYQRKIFLLCTFLQYIWNPIRALWFDFESMLLYLQTSNQTWPPRHVCTCIFALIPPSHASPALFFLAFSAAEGEY